MESGSGWKPQVVAMTTAQALKQLCSQHGLDERIWRTPFGDAPLADWPITHRYHGTVRDADGNLIAEVRDEPETEGDPIRRVRRALLRQLADRGIAV